MATRSFTKAERVRSGPVIDALFSKGSSVVYAPPFRFSWISVPATTAHCQVLVVSSRKKFKRSVDRNSQKRRLRELYRLNKAELISALAQTNSYIALSIQFIAEGMPQVEDHRPAFIKGLQKIASAVSKNHP